MKHLSKSGRAWVQGSAARHVLALAAAGMIVAFASDAGATVVVSPSNMNGWTFNSRDSSGNINPNPGSTGSIVTGPGTPPLGVGSANLTAGNGTSGGDGSEELSTTAYNGIKVSDLTSLSYATYDVTNNGQQFPYLSISVLLNPLDPTSTDKFFFEPPYQTPSTGNASLPDQGATAMNTWQTWNALTGGWWDNNGMCNPGTGVTSLSTCLASFPDATIVTDPYGLGGIGFNVGFADPTDQFIGYIDDFTIGVSGLDTTYDFDPSPVPEPRSIALLAAALLGFGTLGGRRTRRA